MDMVGCGASLTKKDLKMAESEMESDANDGSDVNDVNDVILVETSSSQLIAALRAQGYHRFDEPRVRIMGRSFPIFFVPLVLFFVFLLG